MHLFLRKLLRSIKKYASAEKIPAIDSDTEGLIIIIREVELKEKVYNHPIKGNMYNYSYDKINVSPKRYITMEKWEELEDMNTGSFNVFTTSY
jgi:hypothetical protein